MIRDYIEQFTNKQFFAYFARIFSQENRSQKRKRNKSKNRKKDCSTNKNNRDEISFQDFKI
jgi:transposase